MTILEEIEMRKIIAALQMTLNGVVEAPETWVFPHGYSNEEMEQEIGSSMAASDTMLLGRVTYEGFAAYWPHQSGDIADFMNNAPKVVVSTTLRTADWQNSTLISGNVVEELTRLKQQPGKDVNVVGSATLVRSLLREGLLDELRLMVCPVVVGRGRHLFEDGGDQKALTLVNSGSFSTGVLLLTYQPAGTY
jgi:dihydrofolate reductase